MTSEASPTATGERLPGLPVIDVNEYGGKQGDTRQSMNRRLFMQLLVFEAPRSQGSKALAQKLGHALRNASVAGVVYADSSNPRALGLLTWSEDPAHFVDRVRPLFDPDAALGDVTLLPEFTMLGRSYSSGHEPDLGFMLLERPIQNVLNEKYGWHVWYPLRRTGAFQKLDPHEQGQILREHASIGMAYGQKELAHDIRLACHGMDTNDNEFVVGLVSSELHPLSHLVQTMRKTRQTSEFIEKMGPFFVGRVLVRSA